MQVLWMKTLGQDRRCLDIRREGSRQKGWLCWNRLASCNCMRPGHCYCFHLVSSLVHNVRLDIVRHVANSCVGRGKNTSHCALGCTVRLVQWTPGDKAHEGEFTANPNSCRIPETPSSVQSQPTELTPTSISQPGAVQQNHTKRKAQHVSTTSQKRSRMGPSAISNMGKDSAEARSQLIVRFYDPDIKANDAKNRTLEEILSWPDSQLESSHNYIQMLFPLPEGSMFNWDAPVIDLAVMQAFRSRSELRHQLRRSFERMLKFYGFRVSTTLENNSDKDAISEATQTGVNTDSPINADTSASGVKAIPKEPAFPPGAHKNMSVSNTLPYHIVRASNWRKQFQNWAGLFDHNHLRLTRILRCLRVLGLQQECEAFFKALEHAFHDPETRISEKSMGFWRLAVTRPLQWAPDGQKCKWLEAWQQEQESKK